MECYIASILCGGFISLLSVWLSQQLISKNELKRRYVEKQFEAYQELCRSTSEFLSQCSELTYSRTVADVERFRFVLQTQFINLQSSFNSMFLIGDKTLSTFLTQLRSTVPKIFTNWNDTINSTCKNNDNARIIMISPEIMENLTKITQNLVVYIRDKVKNIYQIN